MGNRYDYIIIGTGIAGLMTAWHAAQKKHGVLLVSKGETTQNNTYYAQGGIAAAISPKDSIKSHIEDTLKAGQYKNDLKTVEFIIQQGPAAIKDLKQLGIQFANDLKLEGSHSHHRVSYNKDTIGKTLIQTLHKKVTSLPNVTEIQNHFVTDLIVDKKRCTGIAVIKKGNKQSRIKKLYGKRIVICTGGVGQIYQKTTNPINATGDGIAIAKRAGCKIRDMRHIQFHPTALVSSKSDNTDQLFLLSETLRGEGAHLLNKKLIRFMRKAHPLNELAPRDIISKQIFKQLKQGPVYLDLRHINSKILKTKYPAIYNQLKKLSIDPAKQPVPITPAAHYLCGGIVTDLKAKTSIRNLYAVGEATSTGLHGANRLASNSLLEAIVMAKQATVTPLPKQFPSSAQSQESNPQTQSQPNPTINKKIKQIMWQLANPLATKTQFKQALSQIQALPRPEHPSETLNMLQTAELILIDTIKHL